LPSSPPLPSSRKRKRNRTRRSEMPTGCRLDAHLISLPKSHIIILALSPSISGQHLPRNFRSAQYHTPRVLFIPNENRNLFTAIRAFRRIPSNFAMAKDSPFATVYFSVRRSKSLAYSAPRSLSSRDCAGTRCNLRAARLVGRSIDRSWE